MKKIILTLLLLTFLKFVNAQILLQEKFDDNSRNWKIENSEHFSVKIADGFLEVEKKRTSNNRSACLWYSKDIGFTTENDYEISFDVKVIKTDSLNYFDFSWGQLNSSDDKIFYHLSYSNERKFHLEFFDGRNPGPTRWKYFPTIIKAGLAKSDDFNKFKIIQKGDLLSIYFNDTLVIQQKLDKIKGGSIGFLHCMKVKFLFDNLVIKQINI